VRTKRIPTVGSLEEKRKEGGAASWRFWGKVRKEASAAQAVLFMRVAIIFFYGLYQQHTVF
jgi:hypothetical protein